MSAAFTAKRRGWVDALLVQDASVASPSSRVGRTGGHPPHLADDSMTHSAALFYRVQVE